MEPEAYSLRDFCQRYAISRATYYNLKKRNLAPAEYHVGRKVMIARKSAEDWQRAMMEKASPLVSAE